MTRDATDGVQQREGRASVDVPGRVLDRVESRLPRTRFDSTDEYVTYVLEEVLARVEEADDGGADAGERVDEREVEERLESLGYLE